MTLKYYDTYLSVAPSSSKDRYREDLQQLINQQFYNTSSIYTILEEKTKGLGDWQDVDVRINHVVLSETGEKLGDDWRKLIFNDLNYQAKLGTMFYFSDNYWLMVFTDAHKTTTVSGTIRRCNNVLRWYDESNRLMEEPCIVDFDLRLTKFVWGDQINIPQGRIKLIVQNNEYTQKITLNQRFILGSSIFKVDYDNDFIYSQTLNNDSTSLVYLTLFKDAVDNTKDDFQNHIASGLVHHNTQPTPTTENLILPSLLALAYNTTQTFSVYKYVDGIANSDTFTFSVSGSNSNHYQFVKIDGNHFSVTNKGYDSTPLIITCVNEKDSSVVSINLKLKGLF